MKKILFSNDIALIQRWESILDKNNTQLVEDIETLYTISNALVIFNSCACENRVEVIIDMLVNNNNKILILDRIPEFNKAQRWLVKGIKGYGNAIMTSSYLKSAIEAIEQDMIWLIPDITTQLIQNIFVENKVPNQNNEVFDDLTKKETGIAFLLKKGYTNTEIALFLNVSPNTVKTHIKHIYKKLQVSDRVSFALLFK